MNFDIFQFFEFLIKFQKFYKNTDVFNERNKCSFGDIDVKNDMNINRTAIEYQ